MNKRQSVKVWQLCFVWIFLSLVFFVFSLVCGRYSQIKLDDAVKCLFDLVFRSDSIDLRDRVYSVVLYIRLPRTIAALIVGSALACSGAAFQALFNNPIASPDTLGVTQGAAFGAVLGILFNFNPFTMKIASFLTGCLVAVCVFVLANMLSKGRNLTFFLLLVGMLATSFFQSMVALVKYTADADQKLPQITYWLLGSLGKVSLTDLLPLAVLFIVGIIPLLLFSWRMNMLILSAEEAEAMGLNLKQLRIVIIVSATLLTAISTSVAGCISWFGLLIPHLLRRYVGNDMKKLIPLCITVGGCVLLVMDMIARSVSEQELPISIITSIIGTPVFILILFKDWRNMNWN